MIISRKSLLIIVISALVLTSIPAIFVMVKIYPTPFVVPVGPYGEGDYYYDRIQEIKDGYPLLGNPYFYEHRKEIAPAFFLADWVASVPALLGIPLLPATLFNFLFWSFVAIFILVLFLKKVGLEEKWAVFGAIYCYLAVYLFMIRPVSMQVIFPFFFLFLLACLYWLDSPENKKTILFLSAGAALSAYLYSYTAQIVVVMLGLFAVYFLLRKDWRRLKGIAYSALGFVVMIIPLIIFTIKQVSHPDYWQTMVRIGLVNTHIPLGLFFLSGFFVLIGLLLLVFVWQKIAKGNKDASSMFAFCIIAGISIIGVSGSNIITGKELENAQHLERFIIIWLALVTVIVLWTLANSGFWKNWRVNYKRWFVVTIAVLLVAVIFVDARYFVFYGPTSVLSASAQQTDEWKNVQDYVAPLFWLDQRELLPIVIWAEPDSRINNYIAMLSKHYSLFNMGGILHLVSDEESAERYLVANYFYLSKVKLIEDYKLYAGAGNAVHSWMTNNRKVKICRLFLFPKLGMDCGKIYDAVSWKGEAYFDDLLLKFEKEIKPNIDGYLRKYNVSYIITDSLMGENFQPEKLFGAKLVYDDGRFSVFKYNRVKL